LAIVYFGLGSNMGDREGNIRIAVMQLKVNGVESLRLSSIIETEPVGGPRQGFFLNAALKAETKLSPFALLQVCQKIEQDLGRERAVRNGPRTIDIDILLYDYQKITTRELIIPHPRMWAGILLCSLCLK